jgi:hypothetical protein
VPYLTIVELVLVYKNASKFDNINIADIGLNTPIEIKRYSVLIT